MSIKLFFLECLVIFSTSLLGSDEGEFRGETKAKIEILQKQNDELKTKITAIEKDSQSVEEFKNSITDQDKRIQDLSFYTSLIATLIAILTLIVGAVGVAFPYLMFRQNSKSQEEAKKDIELWKIKTKSEFDAELENFKKIKEEKSLEIKNHTEEAKRKIDGKVQEISNISVEELKQSGVQISKEDEQEIRKESQIISDEAEKENDIDGFITSAKLSFSIQNYGDALRNIEKALSLTNDDTEISQLLFFKGIILDRLNKIEDEIITYDELIKRFSTKTDEIILIQVANALHNKGVKLNDLNRFEEALDVYDEVIKRFLGNETTIIQERVVDALNNKGVRLGIMGRNEEAIEAFDVLLSHFSDVSKEPIQSKVVVCLFNKGYTLGNLNKDDEAILIFDNIFNRYQNSTNDLIQEQVSNALYSKAISLHKISKIEEAIKSYNNFLKIFQTTQNENIKEIVSKVFVNMGIIYGQINQYEDAIATYDNFINLFHKTDNKKIQIEIMRAYNGKGYSLEQQNKFKEALIVFDQGLQKYEEFQNNLLDDQKVKLLLNKGYVFGKLEKYDVEIDIYDYLIKSYKEATDTSILETIATAQFNKGIRLNEMGKDIAALDIFHQLCQQFQDTKNEKIQETIANSYSHIGLIHGRKKRFNESMQAYKEAIKLKSKNPTAYINLLEMQLIALEKFEPDTVDAFSSICKDDKQTLLKFNMLKTIHDTLYQEQSKNISNLKKEFDDIKLLEWGWEELDEWTNSLDNPEVKQRVIVTIQEFKNWQMASLASKEE